MKPLSLKRHRFPPDVIRYAVWLYFRFTMSRDVEDLLAERSVDVSYETVRCWALKFGPSIAKNLRRSRPSPTARWHVDEVIVKIRGVRMYMWRAVDDESAALDVLIQKRRNKAAAIKILKLLKNSIRQPSSLTGFTRTGRPLARLAAQIYISQIDCERITERKIRIFPFEGGSEKCSASSLKASRSVSFQFMVPSTIPSLFNAI